MLNLERRIENRKVVWYFLDRENNPNSRRPLDLESTEVAEAAFQLKARTLVDSLLLTDIELDSITDSLAKKYESTWSEIIEGGLSAYGLEQFIIDVYTQVSKEQNTKTLKVVSNYFERKPTMIQQIDDSWTQVTFRVKGDYETFLTDLRSGKILEGK